MNSMIDFQDVHLSFGNGVFLLDMSIAMVFLECELSKGFFVFFFLSFSLLISSEELAKLWKSYVLLSCTWLPIF